LVLLAAVLLAGPPPARAADPTASDDPRLDWWRRARFGMFVHWGPVSLAGAEIGWSRGAQVPTDTYDRLYRDFNPTHFDARAWLRIARETGMGYFVLTSKHHDGFCLWPSDLTEYDIAATPFGRDIVGELAAAARREKVVFALYHSICDWRHPDYPLGSPGGRSRKPAPDMPRYVGYLQGQLDELLTRYGPLGILWFDGEWEEPWTESLGRELYDFVRARQPRILVNNRVGKGRRDMEGTTAQNAFAGDYDTPEQRVGKYQDDRPWESCITLCEQWAWKPADRLKSLEECLRTLILCAGGDGNLLLNVGPQPDGTFEPRQVRRLEEIGAWMKSHGHTIRDTRGGPYKPGTWGACTRRGRSVFLHLFAATTAAPAPVQLPALPPEIRIRSARVLRDGQPALRITPEPTEAHLRLPIPAEARQPIVTVVELRLDRPAAEVPPIFVPSA
jgi:alpha-L-fucosidase